MFYQFKNKALFEAAMSHPSRDQKNKKNHFERFEFVGDRVLGLSIAHLLYETFPNEVEGELARRLAVLASKETLVKVAHAIDIPTHVSFSEDLGGNRLKSLETIYADATEALIAAVFMDGGFDVARAFVAHYWEPFLHEDIRAPKDVKSTLQEWAQANKKPLPTYEIVERSGPDHAPHFVVAAIIEGLPPVRGEGSSRKLAEQDAAKRFLEGIE